MQRYFSIDKKDNKFILQISDLHHITNVMRMKDKECIEVVHNNNVYLCEVNNVTNNIEINLIKKIDENNNNNVEITLIIPLLKEVKMDLILQKATELGVNYIIPVVMERSIIKLEKDKQSKKIERWNKICKEASEQSKRSDIPVVTNIKTLKELEILDGNKIVCSTIEKDNNIRNYLKKNKICDKINIVIGPEGGLSTKEEELLVNMGFERVSLGNRILRVETVPLFILSVLNYEYME